MLLPFPVPVSLPALFRQLGLVCEWWYVAGGRGAQGQDLRKEKGELDLFLALA